MKVVKKTSGRVRRPSYALVSKALNAAIDDAVEQHRRTGLPLAVWRDGKVVWISAEEFAASRNGKKPSRRRKAKAKR
jgi:hypothetical protein